jgi:hypothetical protein
MDCELLEWSALLLVGLASLVVLSAATAGSMLRPGVIYREYRQVMRGDDWRVTHPGAAVRYPQAKESLPNPTLHFMIGDLAGAISAEAVIGFWGGHYRTSDKKVQFNGRDWLGLPELTTTPDGVLPSSYLQQWNPVIQIPLCHLKEGDNSLEGACGDQTDGFGWGQWGWYGIIVRVSYSGSKAHRTGAISSPSPGSRLTENPVIAVSAAGEAGVERVELFGRYEGPDENGDGVYQEWHYNYHYDVLGDHIGTSVSAPYQVTWRTRWVPDQRDGGISLIARIQDAAGLWYVTEPVTGLSLDRPTSSVKLYRASEVPELFWVRAGQSKSCRAKVPKRDDLGKVLEASLHIRTWNGSEERVQLNSWSDSIAGADHNYAYTIRQVPGSALEHDNVLSFHSETEHHGVEVLWPGPSLIVRYSKGRWKRPADAYCLPIVVSAAGHDRYDKPVEVGINFTALLNTLGAKGGFDEKSIQVVEVGEGGELIDGGVEFQFDKDPGGDSAAHACGTLVFLMRGITAADAVRRFQVCFGGAGCASPPPVVATGIVVAEAPDYQGQDSFRIETESAVYYYHKSGGGFASMFDPSGRDWISYRPGGGPRGEYRGIPNVINPEGGFHPGADMGASRLLSHGPVRTRIYSETLDGKWACIWDIYPRYARLTMLKAGHPYWVLYEGTPAGELDEQNQYWVRSDGEQGPASSTWEHPLPGFAWVYFGERQGLNRVIYLARHEADGHMDSYWPMQSAMTVFGFGRDNSDRERWSNLTRVPAHFTIGFAEAGRTADARAAILSAVRDLTVSVGAPMGGRGPIPPAARARGPSAGR